MSDEQLIQLYLDRDARALDETRTRYGAYCAAIAGRLLRDSRDVEECLNDCWLAVWNAIPPARPQHFKGWLAAIVRNRALAIGQSNGRRPDMVDEAALELAACLPDLDGPAGAAEAQELADTISRFLWTQSPAVRAAFVRRYWYADPVADVAQHMGWSLSKTKSILFRTRNRLWNILKKEGLICERNIQPKLSQ